jgi:membrane-bound metal-dependent hydrolase YbcI (DUF457 family)
MTILLLIWVHFMGDLLFQSHAMATNKSKSLKWLSLHALVYALCFVWCGVLFAIIAGLTHLIVDGMTSRGTARLWQKGEMHWFFVLIGLDQAIHLSILVCLANVLPLWWR